MREKLRAPQVYKTEDNDARIGEQKWSDIQKINSKIADVIFTLFTITLNVNRLNTAI